MKITINPFANNFSTGNFTLYFDIDQPSQVYMNLPVIPVQVIAQKYTLNVVSSISILSNAPSDFILVSLQDKYPQSGDITITFTIADPNLLSFVGNSSSITLNSIKNLDYVQVYVKN